MISISGLRLLPGADQEELRIQAARALGVDPSALGELTVARQSIDARKKIDLHWDCTVEVSLPNEAAVLRSAPGKNVALVQREEYVFPPVTRRSPLRPVVCGMGPAGLFAALFLARNGIPCLVLERGQDVDRRVRDTERFWTEGILDPESNVQFGEGGAGTFSDGKLTTGTHNRRANAVYQIFAEHGAPPDILYIGKPHIGTDVLRDVLRSMRRELLSLGCEIRFGTRLTGLTVSGGALTGVEAECSASGEHFSIPADALILAPGHSARDTFAMLRDAGVPMERKNFAIGVRIEHSQARISRAQYGRNWEQMPPSDYKLACHLPGGRTLFTFCVCPGGTVVSAASEEGCTVTNGMSLRARDGTNINGGLLTEVTPEDFPEGDVLSGVEFQRQWERAAFRLGGDGYRSPAQRVGDFLADRPSEGPGRIQPTCSRGVTWTSLDSCLPPYVLSAIREGIPIMDRKVRWFADPDAVLTGVETRSSSPVRILRDRSGQSPLRGLFPCGEGSGWAGGIVSAAVDGIKAAEAVACMGPVSQSAALHPLPSPPPQAEGKESGPVQTSPASDASAPDGRT